MGLGGLEGARLTSPESLVIDNEIIDYALRYIKGFEVNKESLAVEVIQKTGARGSYPGEQHTLDHFRERWQSRIADISAFETWEKEGSKSLDKVAKERVGEILAAHRPEPLSQSVEKEISYILKKAETEIGSFS